jgi:nucleotide-binding universal stress UspA family protein
MKTSNHPSSMKYILVLTDFSKSAINAAGYAAHLAERLHVNLLLFNSYLIPDLGFDSWKFADISLLSKGSENKLLIEAERLRSNIKNIRGSFKPEIESISSEGEIAENVKTIIQERKNISMVVMGGWQLTNNDDALFGMEITKVLKKVKCPTIIVPESVLY